MTEQSYSPHDPGHDYYAAGVYLVTLVVTGRECLLSALNMDANKPEVVMTELGEAVKEEWEKTAAIQASKGHKIKLHAAVCMPDHFHGVIEVEERMDVSIGYVVQLFKAACTGRWRKMTGFKETPSTAAMIRHMSRDQRRVYYNDRIKQGQRMATPLFDDNYDDTICIDERHKVAMVNYVHDNPRRAIIRKLRPQFMERRLHIKLAIPDKNGMARTNGNGGIMTRDYAAFGNLFLLRWARKVQVFCHRKAADGRTPYETTEAYREDCRRWKRMVMEGQTVIVTPGISMGERIIKDRCIESGYPLIHLQREPITALWKPERRRFDACCRGSLLILAPWKAEELGDVMTKYGHNVPSGSDYSIFHNLNGLAEEICLFEGEARVCKD